MISGGRNAMSSRSSQSAQSSRSRRDGTRSPRPLGLGPADGVERHPDLLDEHLDEGAGDAVRVAAQLFGEVQYVLDHETILGQREVIGFHDPGAAPLRLVTAKAIEGATVPVAASTLPPPAVGLRSICWFFRHRGQPPPQAQAAAR